MRDAAYLVGAPSSTNIEMPILCRGGRRVAEQKERVADRWKPRGHVQRERLAASIAFGHSVNADVCTCENGDRQLGTPSWLCRERRCYAYEIGACENPGSEEPGDATCICMVGAWDPFPCEYDPVPWYRKTKSQRLACLSEQPEGPWDGWPWNADPEGWHKNIIMGIPAACCAEKPRDMSDVLALPYRKRGRVHMPSGHS